MYWHVVEVRPEKDYSLWLRFADGSEGTVTLESNTFTGVLKPLREPSVFDQVFVEHGAVAWPGEIDLAPDGLYRTLKQLSLPH